MTKNVLRKGLGAFLIATGLLSAATVFADDSRNVQSAPASLAGRLLLSGSSTMTPLMVAIGKRFQSLHPGVQVEVVAGGSGRGISDVRAGKADIGMVSRTLSEQDADLHGVPIARDGIGVVVHRDNPVRALSNQQLTDIFCGRIGNWKSVGGRNAPITVVNPTAGYGSVELFTHYFKLRYEEIKAGVVSGDNAARLAVVTGDPNAITYVSVGESERQVKAGAPIRVLPVGGVAATSKNIRSGEFPIARPLNLVTRGRPTGLARALIEFSLSSQVTEIILANDFVPYLD